MKESIHQYFQVGTILWMSWPKTEPMEALRRVARDDFFDAIELKSFGERNEEAREILRQSHMKVCYGAQPRLLGPKLNPNALEEGERASVTRCRSSFSWVAYPLTVATSCGMRSNRCLSCTSILAKALIRLLRSFTRLL